MEPLSQRFASLLRPMLSRCGCKLDHVTRNKSTKKRIAEREERKKEVIQLKGDNTKPVDRVYVWGHAATGALGVRTYLRPESKRQNPIKEQSRPARLRFMDDNDIKKMGRKRRRPGESQSDEGGASQSCAGKQSKKQKSSLVEKQSTVVRDTFVWAKLRGCPMWPTKVVKQLNNSKVLCFVKSDDAEIPVNVADIMPFRKHLNKLKNHGIGALTKKKQMAMLNCFLSDVDWALWEIHEQESSSTTAKPDASSHTTEPDGQKLSSTTAKPDASSHTTEPDGQESSSTIAKPDASSHTTEPDGQESSSTTAKPDASSHTTEPDGQKLSSTTAKPDASSHTTEPDGQKSSSTTAKPDASSHTTEPDGQKLSSTTAKPDASSHTTEPDGQKLSSTTAKPDASSHTTEPDGQKSLSTTAKTDTSSHTTEPDGQESLSTTAKTDASSHTTEPDGQESSSTTAKPDASSHTTEPDGQKSLSTTAKTDASSHTTEPDGQESLSTTAKTDASSHTTEPDGQESSSTTAKPDVSSHTTEPDGQDLSSTTAKPDASSHTTEPDGHESSSTTAKTDASSHTTEPDGQESVSTTAKPDASSHTTEPDGQESSSTTAKTDASSHTTEPDGQEFVTSSDSEGDYHSSGSEWVPRNSDASESSCETDDRNNNYSKSVEPQSISESSGIDENDRNSDVWPMLTKDCLMNQNSKEVCTINSQSLFRNSEKDVCKETNSNVSSEDESLDEESIERDKENPKFYIRAVLRSAITKTGKLKKKDRVYNAFQYCEVCTKRVSNFAQHMQRNEAIHKNCPEIMTLKTETDRTKRDQLRNILRGKYNHRYNMKNIKKGHGEIILERRPVGKFHLKEFGPCPNCYLWVSKRLLNKHQKSCNARKPLVTSSSSLITQSDTLSGRIKDVASKALVNEVFTKMKMDDVGKLARQDPLIIHLGNQWMQKNVGNKLKRGAYTSAIMRLVARLLLNLQNLKLVPEPCMSSYLKPEHFDTVCHATIVTSATNMDDEEDLLKPSNAIKIGFDLKRLADGKIGHALTSGNKAERKEAEDFSKMMQIFWGTRITKLARVILEQRKFGQEVHLPHPKDIKDLYLYLQKTLAELDLRSTNFDNYRAVCEAVEARLIVYNRRRTGEVQAVRVESYEKRRKGGDTYHLMGQLTEFEKKLLETQEVMTVRGKVGRGVPIILPFEVKDALEFITDRTVRRSAGIKPDNTYLFASQGDGVFWGYDVLYKACQRANLNAPDRITSTSLRKYMATLTQVLDLQPHQLQWVLNHLGHTLDVHKIYYRATSDVLERTQIAKILLLQDHDRLGEFHNKKLEDIQFTGRVLDYLIEPVVVDIPQASDTTGAGLKAKVACGRAHSVILVNNEVYAQGNNAYGQCGRSAVTGEIFHKVSNIQKVQDLPENVSKIVCGQDHTFFLTDNGELYSCGMGADGQTGLGTFSAVGRPTLVGGDIQGVKIVDISSRADCVLAVSEDGQVFGWGNSEYHQLSMVTDSTQVNVPRHLPITDCGKVVKVAAGGSICALVNDNGNVFVWGFGILGKGPKVDMLERPSKLPAELFGCNELQPFIKVLDVKCGMSHFAAYTDQGDMFTWGKGKYGCLGLHEYREQYFPLKLALPAFAHGVECGVDHTAALCTSFA